jgi:Secretion system C-terminal sorting domain
LNGRVVWGHGGDIRGYRSRIVYDTASKAVLCILTNSNPLDVNTVAGELLLTLIQNTQNGLHDKTDTAAGIQVLPNPATTQFHIFTKDQKLRYVRIFSIDGRFVSEHFTPDIVIQNLPSGIYYLSIQTDKSTGITKLIKQ